MTKFSISSHDLREYLMTVNKLSVGINMPEALKSQGSGDSEHAHSLPPYHRRRTFLVDEYPACPPDWLRSSGRIKSYFVPIRDGAGLWLDFNSCLNAIQHDVAIVVSVQGVNAVTGLPCKDAQLEQYRDECPKHKKAFGPDRLCKTCGFKWPKQNYVCSTGTPQGQLWLDGFRAEDGKVRQYVFTKSIARSVAAAIIGGDRVHALGISFFLSKNQRPKPVSVVRSNHLGGEMKFCSLGDDTPIGSSIDSELYSGSPTYSCSVNSLMDSGLKREFTSSLSKGMSVGPVGKAGEAGPHGPAGTVKIAARHSAMLSQVQDVEKLEVAAGARIDQHIYDDPCSLEDWQAEPEGLIVINYCTEADADRILAGGRVDLAGHPEGFLQKVPIGNA